MGTTYTDFSSPGLVSIVLPVFNGEKFLHEALESILSQTYRHWELLVVDDGSTDRSAEIALEQARVDSRISVHRQVNLKLPAALNAGFSFAHGEYFTWISADNRMAPDFLQRLVRELELHPAWDMVIADMRLINDDGLPLRGSTHILPYQDPHDSAVVHYPDDTSIMERETRNVVGGAFLYRSICGRLLGDYDPAYFTAEDYDYWLRMREFFTVKHASFNDPVYEYRIHATSLTSQAQAHQTVELSQRLLRHHAVRKQIFQAGLKFSVVTAPDSGPLARPNVECAIKDSGYNVMPASLTSCFAPDPTAVCLHIFLDLPQSRGYLTAVLRQSGSRVTGLIFDPATDSGLIDQIGDSSDSPTNIIRIYTTSLGSAIAAVAIRSKVRLSSANGPFNGNRLAV